MASTLGGSGGRALDAIAVVFILIRGWIHKIVISVSFQAGEDPSNETCDIFHFYKRPAQEANISLNFQTFSPASDHNPHTSHKL